MKTFSELQSSSGRAFQKEKGGDEIQRDLGEMMRFLRINEG
jgi:hypothetical protein